MLRKLSVRNPVLWAWLRGGASVLVVLAAGSLAFVGVSFVGLGSSSEPVAVPNVIGEPEGRALVMLAEAGLAGHVAAHNHHEQVPHGHVIGSEPPPLMQVRTGRRVELIISGGPRKISVPKVVELTVDDAKLLLATAGFELGRVTRRHSDQPLDHVLSQSPAGGEKLARGEAIDLVLSGGADFGQLRDRDGHSLLLRRVRIVVPAGPTVQRVRITLNHRYGARDLYDRIHRPGDEILIDFTAATGDRLHVYVDDRLAERKRL